MVTDEEGVGDMAGLVSQVLSDGGKTYALWGDEGCGKSSICAHLAREAESQHLRFVHLHLAEQTRYSCNPVFAIRRILRNLKVLDGSAGGGLGRVAGGLGVVKESRAWSEGGSTIVGSGCRCGG